MANTFRGLLLAAVVPLTLAAPVRIDVSDDFPESAACGAPVTVAVNDAGASGARGCCDCWSEPNSTCNGWSNEKYKCCAKFGGEGDVLVTQTSVGDVPWLDDPLK